MTTILIADDSAIERKLAAGLLSRDLECEVLSATDGQAALDVLAQRRGRVDLVVSDLAMPVLDGMELLTQIREHYRDVPVVIMTCRGCEETAVRALQNGAAGYVPKRRLKQELPETVQRVLAANRHSRNHAAVVRRVVDKQFTLELGNDRTELPAVIGYLQATAERAGVCGSGSFARLGVALEEALLNALIHGNLEVSSELRHDDDGSFERLIDERRAQHPYCTRKLRVTCRVDRSEVSFCIRDEGPGFDPSTIPDPTDPQNLLTPSGRGLLLMRAFVDRVEHNATGNEITLAMSRTAAGDDASPVATPAAAHADLV